MSRPCINCVRRLTNLPQYSGYRISNVFYTEGDTVTKVRLNHLASQPTQHIPRFQTYNGMSQINGRWRAKPNYEGKSHHLGYFPTSREAADAVREFLEQQNNTHVCHHHSHSHSSQDEDDQELDDEA